MSQNTQSKGQPSRSEQGRSDILDDEEEVHFEMITRHSSLGDLPSGGWLSAYGKLIVTRDRVVFAAPRQIVDTDLDAIEVIQHRRDRFNGFMFTGVIGFVLGLLLHLIVGSLHLVVVSLYIISLILALLGILLRGEALVLVTAGETLRFRTKQTNRVKEAAKAIRHMKKSADI